VKPCDFLYVPPGLAKNPYRPGVGTRPPYLAGRDEQLQRFYRILEDYPEKRNNLRMTGLRGVGKTVLLKEFERISRREGWAVVRRDLSPRLCTETDFAVAISDYLRDGVEQLSVVAKIKNRMADAARAAGAAPAQLAAWFTWPRVEQIALALLLAAHLALAVVYSVATPLLEGWDEVGHFVALRHVSRPDVYPSATPAGRPNEANQPPLYYLLAVPAFSIPTN